MRIRLEPYELPLRAPLVTAAGDIEVRRGWLVHLTDHDGHAGLGDAAPLPGFSIETHVEVETALREWDGSSALPLPAAARHGAEQALISLQAARERRSFGHFLGGVPRAVVPVARLVRSLDEARTALDAGLTTLKLKVAHRPLADDIATVRALRALAGASVQLRLDANRGWSLAQARAALEALAELDLEFIEEPCAGGPEVLRQLRGPVPIAADESVRDHDDLERIIELDAVDVVVLKPMLVGGPALTVALAERAHQAGLGVVISTALESAVGRAAALHVASVNPSPLAAGLDTGHLFTRDLAPFPAPRLGALSVP